MILLDTNVLIYASTYRSPFLEWARSSSIRLVLLTLSFMGLCAAPARAVPDPPAERADRFGVYFWGSDSSTWPGSPNRLAWGADKVAEIGSRTIRVYMGPNDSYSVNPPGNPNDDLYLQRIAASPAYDALFRDPRFRTYLLTVSTSTGSRTTLAAAQRQIARLGSYLLGEPGYAGKTFILLNWEGDNAAGTLPPDSPKWQDLIGRTEARANGVRDARAQQPGSAAQLYSGLEFNLVARNGVRCGDGQVRCIIDTVAPRVSVDYYSYSAWQTLDVKRLSPEASLTKAVKADLGFALAKVRSRRPKIQEENFILGEWGFARSIYSECQASRNVWELVRAFEGPSAFHVSYAIYWQALDNGWRGGRRTPCVGDLKEQGDPDGQVDWMLYGLFRGRDGAMTLSGSTYQALLRNQPLPDLPRCPSIDPQGVVSPQSGGPIFHPGGPITVSGAGFGNRGNDIMILQAHDRQSKDPNVLVDLNRLNSESPRQITAMLPTKELHDGCALVWVESGNGVESNAILVRIKPE
jgi:hypothetical protein